mgnify:CR=1 FL=1
MIASKLERRILVGELLSADITGKPLKALEHDMSEHADAEALTAIYDKTVEKLNEQASPEERVTDALGKVKADLAVS